MPTITRKLSIVIGVIIVASVLTSVSYYELAMAPIHYGYVSMSTASSVLNTNLTQEQKNPSLYGYTPFQHSASNQMMVYSGSNNYGPFTLFITEGHFNSTSSANGLYVNTTSFMKNGYFAYNQSYRGFTFTYMNDSPPHTGLSVRVFAVGGTYVFTMSSAGSVSNSAEVATLVKDQINSMV